jgi:hypothetical protein
MPPPGGIGTNAIKVSDGERRGDHDMHAPCIEGNRRRNERAAGL